ncbi:MAG: hypothetical protein FWE69_05890 [Clostridiales bacterium]|nr:hypothetical protein [Clostridiales bacterium]
MKTNTVAPHKSSLGLDANLVVLFTYLSMHLFGWWNWVGLLAIAGPLVFFFIEKNSRFVKFHAVQAAGIGAVWGVLNLLFSILRAATRPRYSFDWVYGVRSSGWGAYTAIGVISTIVSVALSVLMVYMIISAWNYKEVELPIIGPIARNASK